MLLRKIHNILRYRLSTKGNGWCRAQSAGYEEILLKDLRKSAILKSARTCLPAGRSARKNVLLINTKFAITRS